MYCVNHPSVETRVTCSNCDEPICPDCMVFTPVGVKCSKCARMPKSALITVKPERVALTILVGLGAALAGGFIFNLFISVISFFAIIAAYGLGYGIGEAISWASGRHHSGVLAGWAASCAALSILYPIALRGLLFYGPSANVVSFIISFGGVWKLLWIAAAAYGAWRRNVI